MRTAHWLVPLLVSASTLAQADAYDCFPMCPQPEPAESKPASLCDVAVVREAAHANARLERDLKPIKEVYEIATNPTGYAIKMVDQHVVHIPKWVGYAMDPKGAIKSEIMKRAREAVKKQAGLQDNCVAPADDGEEDFS